MELADESILPGIDGVDATITCDKLRLSDLGMAISEFDFESARKKLDEVAKEYGTKWELSK